MRRESAGSRRVASLKGLLSYIGDCARRVALPLQSARKRPAEERAQRVLYRSRRECIARVADYFKAEWPLALSQHRLDSRGNLGGDTQNNSVFWADGFVS